MIRPYKVPAYPAIPIFVAVLSGIAGCLYMWSNVQVILPTAALYLAASLWYALWARKKVLPVAPEELAARIAEEIERTQDGPAAARDHEPAAVSDGPHYTHGLQKVLERISGPFLLLGIFSLAWMVLRALGVAPAVFSEAAEVTSVTMLWSLLFVLLSAVGLMSARNHGR